MSNFTDYSIFTVPNKAQQHIKNAFRKTEQSPGHYDLFPISCYIERYLDYNARERCRLTTTGQIIAAINYMIDNDLFD